MLNACEKFCLYFNRKICNDEALELGILLSLQCFRQCNNKNRTTECKTRARQQIVKTEGRKDHLM